MTTTSPQPKAYIIEDPCPRCTPSIFYVAVPPDPHSDNPRSRWTPDPSKAHRFPSREAAARLASRYPKARIIPV